jgi:hypothetical protein
MEGQRPWDSFHDSRVKTPNFETPSLASLARQTSAFAKWGAELLGPTFTSCVRRLSNIYHRMARRGLDEWGKRLEPKRRETGTQISYTHLKAKWFNQDGAQLKFDTHAKGHAFPG